MVVRELCPKDFYYAQNLRNSGNGILPLIFRLCSGHESLPARIVHQLSVWVSENVLKDNIFLVEDWLELSFHLCKQRWDSSMDWLEQQPMGKIHYMVDITKRFAEKQAEV